MSDAAKELADRAPQQEYVSPAELAAWIGVSVGTLAQWRVTSRAVQRGTEGKDDGSRYSPRWYQRLPDGGLHMQLCYVTAEVRDWILAHPTYVKRLGCMVKPDRPETSPVDRGALQEIMLRMPLGYWLTIEQVCAWLGAGRVTLWRWRENRRAASAAAKDRWPPHHVGDDCLPDARRDADGIPVRLRSGPGKPIAYMRTEVAEWLERRPWTAARVLGVRVPRRGG